METIEVVIYMLVAVVAGTSLVYFYTIMDSDKIYNKMSPGKEIIKIEYTKTEFIENVFDIWDSCQRGATNKNYTVFVNSKTETELGKEEITEYLKKSNKDDQLRPEDIYFFETSLPKVMPVRCYDEKLYMGDAPVFIIINQDTSIVECYISDNKYFECYEPKVSSGITVVTLRTVYGPNNYRDENITIYITKKMVIDATKATYISSGQPSQNFDSDNNLYVGKDASGIYRSLIKFENLPEFDYSMLVNVTVKLTQQPSGNEILTLNTKIPTGQWESATWQNKPDAYPNEYFPDIIVRGSDSFAYVLMNTQLLEQWYMDREANTGLMLIADDESQNNKKTFYSDNYNGDEYRPKLIIEYIE